MACIVEYALQRNARTIIRGLRAISDFDYEFQLALMNRRLERGVETVFRMTGFGWFTSAPAASKNAARCHGNISGLVPKHVERALREKFAERARA
jgi:pantetheine-phosphate adenylyltransferase